MCEQCGPANTATARPVDRSHGAPARLRHGARRPALAARGAVGQLGAEAPHDACRSPRSPASTRHRRSRPRHPAPRRLGRATCRPSGRCARRDGQVPARAPHAPRRTAARGVGAAQRHPQHVRVPHRPGEGLARRLLRVLRRSLRRGVGGPTGALAGPVDADATGGSQGFAQLVCLVGDFTAVLPTRCGDALADAARWRGSPTATALDTRPGRDHHASCRAARSAGAPA